MDDSRLKTVLLGSKKERRQSKRVLTNFPVKCKVVSGINFQQSKLFRKLNWRCVEFSSHGIILQTQGKVYSRFLKPLRPLLHALSDRLRIISKKRVHYPPVPPSELKMVVEINVPLTKNVFTLNGRLVWFRPLWRNVYRMAIQFDGPQQFIVHDHGDGNVYLTTYFSKEILTD